MWIRHIASHDRDIVDVQDAPVPIPRSKPRSGALPRFSRLALQLTTKAVIVVATRRDGKGKEKGRPWDVYVGGEKRGTTRAGATEGVEKCQPANWKRGRKGETGGWKSGRGVGWDRTGDSLRQPRRQINMPGRAISNIRRSRRVGASCVRARELRWWRLTAGRIRDQLARPVAIASVDRKVNGRRSVGIKDPLTSPVCSKDESLWTCSMRMDLGKPGGFCGFFFFFLGNR